MPDLSRYLVPQIKKDMEEKIVLLGGPRQVGKTYLSRHLLGFKNCVYLNFDSDSDRKTIFSQTWDRDSDIVIFDELHKRKGWKRWVKGIYDTEGVRPRLLVTGSAKMDIFRKGGDSLAGRHHSLRLHPLSIREIDPTHPDETLDHLLRFSGFPEPFLKANDIAAARWRKSHFDRILREDLLDLEKVRELKSIEILVDLLAQRVGSGISYASLARDLEVSPHTIKHWIQVLENLFVIFSVTPFANKLSKSILKEPKIYFFDYCRVPDAAARLENLVACHLLKQVHYWEDTLGQNAGLHYLRDKERREVDFVVSKNGKATHLIEVKTADTAISPSLHYYTDRLAPQFSTQLVKHLKHIQQKGKVKTQALSRYLAELEV